MHKLDGNIARILFDDSSKEFILSLFEKEMRAGQIYGNGTDEEAKSFEGDPLTINELGGVRNGPELFIEDNILSLFRLRSRGK